MLATDKSLKPKLEEKQSNFDDLGDPTVCIVGAG